MRIDKDDVGEWKIEECEDGKATTLELMSAYDTCGHDILSDKHCQWVVRPLCDGLNASFFHILRPECLSMETNVYYFNLDAQIKMLEILRDKAKEVFANH